MQSMGRVGGMKRRDPDIQQEFTEAFFGGVGLKIGDTRRPFDMAVFINKKGLMGGPMGTEKEMEQQDEDN